MIYAQCLHCQHGADPQLLYKYAAKNNKKAKGEVGELQRWTFPDEEAQRVRTGRAKCPRCGEEDSAILEVVFGECHTCSFGINPPNEEQRWVVPKDRKEDLEKQALVCPNCHNADVGLFKINAKNASEIERNALLDENQKLKDQLEQVQAKLRMAGVDKGLVDVPPPPDAEEPPMDGSYADAVTTG